MSLRQAEPLSYARAAANNPKVIEAYFDLLEQTIETNGLAHRPGQIFNCDETGMHMTHKPPKVVAGVGQKHPYTVTSGDRAHITIMACASASGYSIPPIVIFSRKHLHLEMTMGSSSRHIYGWLEVYLVDQRAVLMQQETPGNHPSPTPTPFVPFCTPRRNGSAIRHLPSHTPFILLAGDGVLSGTEGIN